VQSRTKQLNFLVAEPLSQYSSEDAQGYDLLF